MGIYNAHLIRVLTVHLGRPNTLRLLGHLHQTEYPLFLPPHLPLYHIHQVLHLHWCLHGPLAGRSHLWRRVLLCAHQLLLGQVDQDWWALLRPVCLYPQLDGAEYLYGCCSVGAPDSNHVEVADEDSEEVRYSWDFSIRCLVSTAFPFISTTRPRKFGLRYTLCSRYFDHL